MSVHVSPTVEAFNRANTSLIELAEGLGELNGRLNDAASSSDDDFGSSLGASMLGYVLLAAGFKAAAQNFADALSSLLEELKAAKAKSTS